MILLKKILSFMTMFVMCLNLAVPVDFSYAETTDTIFSDYIELDLNDVELKTDSAIQTGTDYDYCQDYFYQQLDSTNQYCYTLFYENFSEPTQDALTFNVQPIKYVTISTSTQSKWTDEERESVETLAAETFSCGLSALLLDHPEIFWLDTQNIKFAYGYNVRRTMNGSVKLYVTALKIQPQICVNYTEGDLDSEIENALAAYETFNETLNNIEISGDTDYEKLKSIYEYVAETATYNADSGYNASTAGSVLSEPHYAVCEGYAHAVKLLCDREGIPCVTVGGNYVASSNTGHAWNEVYLDGNWYGADVTWDDLDNENILTYKYFCKGSNNFSTYHTPGSVYLYIEFSYPVLAENDYVTASDTTEETTEPETETTSTTTTTTEITTTTTTTTTTTIPVTTTLTTTTEIPVTTSVTEPTTVTTTTTQIPETTSTVTTAVTTTSITVSESTTESTATMETEPTETTSEITYVLIYGDTNSDGEINIADAVYLNKYLVNCVTLNEQQSESSDVNLDNKIDSVDTLIILKYLVGTYSSLPVSD